MFHIQRFARAFEIVFCPYDIKNHPKKKNGLREILFVNGDNIDNTCSFVHHYVN